MNRSMPSALSFTRTLLMNVENSLISQNVPRPTFEVPIQAAIGHKIVALRISKLFVKTFLLNVMVVTYPVNVNSLKNKNGKKQVNLVDSIEVPQGSLLLSWYG